MDRMIEKHKKFPLCFTLRLCAFAGGPAARDLFGSV